jgi:hypothetical protein
MVFGLSFATNSAFVAGFHPLTSLVPNRFGKLLPTKGGSMFGLARERMSDETLTTEGTEDTAFRDKKINEAVLGLEIGVQKLQCPMSKRAQTAFTTSVLPVSSVVVFKCHT